MAYSQAELSAKKVADLKTILADYKLPGTGVKAELVSRILEHQQTTGAAGEPKTDLPAAANALGSIPAEDELPSTKADGAESSSTAAAPAAAADSGANGDAEAPGATEAAIKADEPGLPAQTDKNSEAEKRKARLARFGNTEELAKLDRADKFGTGGSEGISDKTVTLLDSELSNKRVRVNANGDSKPAQSSKPKSTSGKPQSAAGGQSKKPVSKGKPTSKAAAPAPKAVDPEEEERRRKRAERFSGATA